MEGDFDADADVDGFAVFGAGFETPLFEGVDRVAVFALAQAFDDFNIDWVSLRA